MGSSKPAVGRGNRTVTVAGKLTDAEKRELDRVVAGKDDFTLSDAVRAGVLLFLAIETFTPPDEQAGGADAN